MSEHSRTHAGRGHGGRHGGHGWLMIACCIPMIGIAVALVATGIASPGFLVVALACTGMMALMMVGMNRGGGASQDGTDASTPADHHRSGAS